MEGYGLVTNGQVRSSLVVHQLLWKNSLWPLALLLVMLFSLSFKLVKFSDSECSCTFCRKQD